MRLKILLPNRTLLDEEVDKVVAESPAGSFCLEPRHVDWVAPVVPGILSYARNGGESFVGTSDGILVKADGEVLVSVRDAVSGADLGAIRHAVRERLARQREDEAQAREVADKLETTLVRRFIEFEEEEHRGRA